MTYAQHRLGIMRIFKTKHFTVVADALEERDLDLAFDEDGSIREGLESGEFTAFTAHVYVMLNGRIIGEDYLGNCIYKDFDDFMDHKECGKQDRERAAQGKEGRCGSYFSDMIHTAIAEARKTLAKERSIYVRQ